MDPKTKAALLAVCDEIMALADEADGKRLAPKPEPEPEPAPEGEPESMPPEDGETMPTEEEDEDAKRLMALAKG